MTEYKKLKLETIAQILSPNKPDTFMAKLNAKGTYHSVPIHQPNQQFHFNDTLYQYATLPNGYTEGSRKILQNS